MTRGEGVVPPPPLRTRAQRRDDAVTGASSGDAQAGTLATAILALVLERLDPADVLRASGVCRAWREVATDDAVWAAVLRRWSPAVANVVSAKFGGAPPPAGTHRRVAIGLSVAHPCRRAPAVAEVLSPCSLDPQLPLPKPTLTQEDLALSVTLYRGCPDTLADRDVLGQWLFEADDLRSLDLGGGCFEGDCLARQSMAPDSPPLVLHGPNPLHRREDPLHGWIRDERDENLHRWSKSWDMKLAQALSALTWFTADGGEELVDIHEWLKANTHVQFAAWDAFLPGGVGTSQQK